ncbi:MAG: hypothetical protein VW934_00950 [Alphaproteobacteria bacterium]
MTFYLSDLSQKLADGKCTSRELVETCLAAIDSEDGRRAFIETYETRVRDEADFIDAQRKAGRKLPPFAGIPPETRRLYSDWPRQYDRICLFRPWHEPALR